jgi:hypothetical protein
MKQNLLTPEEAQKVNVQAWIYEPGIPANLPPVKSEAFAAIDKQIEAWKGGAAASSIQTSSWSTQEWQHFLRGIPDTMTADHLQDLDKTFKLSESGNSEILFIWLNKVIDNRYEPGFPALEKFLTSQGRRKFVAPLYAALAKSDWGKAMATRIYTRARPTYHSVATGTIDKALNWPQKK